MGGGGGVSDCPCVASRGSSSPPARLLSSGRGGGASGYSFGARKLASIFSVHLWLGRPELLSCGGLLLPFSVQVGSPSSSLDALRGDGVGESLGAFSGLGSFPASSLHALRGGGRGSLPSSAPVRIPPWLPDLRLGKPGRCFEPALGRMALVIGLVAHAVTQLSVLS